MWSNMWSQSQYSFMHGLWMPWLFAVMVWALVWKGLALWKAARRGESVWFVALLVINTFGILEILYLYVFTKKTKPVK